jgi:hypothetical protein
LAAKPRAIAARADAPVRILLEFHEIRRWRHPKGLGRRYTLGREMRGSTPRSKAMPTRTLVAAFLAVALLSPSYAADLCNDDHMQQMDGMIAKMTDEAKKKDAMAALDKSKAAMKAGDNASCMKYMDEAHKAMGM